MYHKETNCWLRHIYALFVMVLLGGLLWLPVAQPALAAQEGAAQANIIVTLSPDPTLYVTRGEDLNIRVDVENIGNADASIVQVTLPFDEDQFALEDVRFDQSQGWVENYDDDSVTLAFRQVEVSNDDDDDGNEQRAATVVLNVAPTVPIDEELTLQASYGWNDAQQRGAGTSNQVQVTARAAEASRTLQDDETGQADTTAPSSAIVAITRDGNGFVVRWSGVDNASGVAYYDVQVCQMPCTSYGWQDWRTNTTNLSEWFGPAEGKDFAFRVRAVDFAGNIEPWTASVSMDTTQAD